MYVSMHHSLPRRDSAVCTEIKTQNLRIFLLRFLSQRLDQFGVPAVMTDKTQMIDSSFISVGFSGSENTGLPDQNRVRTVAGVL